MKKIFLMILLSVVTVYSQTYTIPLTNVEITRSLQQALDIADSVLTRAQRDSIGAIVSDSIDSVIFWTTPEMFGAVGDGVTDDTNALQAAIDYWGAYGSPWTSGGGYVYLSGKTYLISNTITIRNNIKMIGVGADQGTVIQLKANAGDIGSMIEIGLRNSSNPISVHLEGFKIEGDYANQTYAINNITTYNYLRHSIFKDLFVVGSLGKNLYMTSDPTYDLGRNNYFYSCAFEYAESVGLEINHDYNLNFLNCYFGFVRGTNGKSVRITMTATGLHIDHCWFLENVNSYNSLELLGTLNQFTITNNLFIAPTANGGAGSSQITLGNTPLNGIISGNIIGGGNYYIIRIGSSNRIQFKDNLMGTALTSHILSSSTNSVIEGNYDMTNSKPQENRGIDSISYTQTQATITHNIYTTPNFVLATPYSNENIWVSDITATTFKVNRASSGATVIFNWEARKEY